MTEGTAAGGAVRLTDNPLRVPTVTAAVRDERGAVREAAIAQEQPLTLYLDGRELLTLMTLGQMPEALAVGWLRNQQVVGDVGQIEEVRVDWEVNAAAVYTHAGDAAAHGWADEQRRTVTSGCGQGTMFSRLMEETQRRAPARTQPLRSGVLFEVLRFYRELDTVYKIAGAVHGCALFDCGVGAGGAGAGGAGAALPDDAESGADADGAGAGAAVLGGAGAGVATPGGDGGAAPVPRLLCHTEDIGRHNAVDAIAGWMWLNGVAATDTLFYTTGRLTSEMVIKCAQMQIPFLVSRSGTTELAYRIANEVGLTMIGRAINRRYLIFSGADFFAA